MDISTKKVEFSMKLKFLVLALCVPAIFTTHATTNYPLFIPDNISTDISLGSLSGKTKERVYHPRKGGEKLVNWTGNTVMRLLLEVASIGS